MRLYLLLFYTLFDLERRKCAYILCIDEALCFARMKFKILVEIVTIIENLQLNLFNLFLFKFFFRIDVNAFHRPMSIMNDYLWHKLRIRIT